MAEGWGNDQSGLNTTIDNYVLPSDQTASFDYSSKHIEPFTNEQGRLLLRSINLDK